MLSKTSRHIITIFGAAFISFVPALKAQSITLVFGEQSDDSSFAPVLQAPELDSSTQYVTQKNNQSSFYCANFKNREAQDNAPHSSLTTEQQTPQLIAQVVSADSGNFFEPPVAVPITETCGLQPLGIGGSNSSGINPLFFSPLGALGLLLGGNDTPTALLPETSTILPSLETQSPTSSLVTPIDHTEIEKVPEPMTILGTGFALGIGVLLERKRKPKASS